MCVCSCWELNEYRQHIKKPAKKFNNSTSCTQACHPCRKPFPTLRSTYIPRMYDFVHSFLVLYMYNWCYLKMKSILLILFLCLIAQLIVVDSYLSIDIQKLPEEQIERFVKYCSSKAQYWRPGRRRYRRFRRFRNRRTVSKSDIRSSLSHSCLIESTWVYSLSIWYSYDTDMIKIWIFKWPPICARNLSIYGSDTVILIDSVSCSFASTN